MICSLTRAAQTGGEKIFQLKQATRGQHIFIGGDPTDG